MSSAVHKLSFREDGPLPLGLHDVPGIPRTIGVDGNGDLAVWYEANNISTHFQILWTGTDLEYEYTLIDTVSLNGLVWHLAVPQ